MAGGPTHTGPRRRALRSAYFQCIGGASGDMILGAIVDAGVPVEELRAGLALLKVEGFALECQRAQRGGVQGSLVTVRLTEEGERRRRIKDFVELVEASDLPAAVAQRAVTVLRRLGEAEAQVHGTAPGAGVLHELGSLDTLVDIVGAVLGLELLGVQGLYSSPMPSGSGVVATEHGPLPVPSPATAALFAMARAPVVAPPGGAEAGEMVTPTGAAIITTLATFRQPLMKLERVGYGLGARESRHYPNVLALWVGEEESVAQARSLELVETNIDDMSPEVVAYVQERLMALGARDVWVTPIQMKKGRPGLTLSVLVDPEGVADVVALLLRETTTLGARTYRVSRYEAERELVEVETTLGTVRVKVKRLEGQRASVKPEYEDCRRIAQERGISILEVMRQVEREATQQLLEA